MRILFLGDIVGRSGRDVVIAQVPLWREKYKLDCVIANGENASHGFGLSTKIARDLFAAGVDVVTLGNHAWDRREMMHEISAYQQIIRPINYPPGTPGKGSYVFGTSRGKRVLVVNVMGRLFMDPLDDPFRSLDTLLERYRLGANVHAIVVDMHAESTSEKMALANHLDGRVSLVVGTHTHVPTRDGRILPGGTGYQTDAGMCGDYDSVIGMRKEGSILRFTRKLPLERLEPASGPGSMCGVLTELDDASGLSVCIEGFCFGGIFGEKGISF